MPQFDPTIMSSQIIWLVITFAVLFYIMARSALPTVSRVLEEREERIADDLDEAERLQKEAGEIEDQVEAILARAKGEAQSIAAEAKADIQKKMSEASRDIDEKLSGKIAEAESQILRAQREAMAGMDQTVVDAAGRIVAKLTGLKPEQDVIEPAADAAIKRIKEQGKAQ